MISKIQSIKKATKNKPQIHHKIIMTLMKHNLPIQLIPTKTMIVMIPTQESCRPKVTG